MKKKTNNTLSEREIISIIKEEYKRARRNTSVREQELGSLSNIEIQELLANYFYRHGGKIPADIMKLSVLFPILQNAGLGNIVKSYKRTAKAFGKEAARYILEDVKNALEAISSDDFDSGSVLKKQEERLVKLLNNLSTGDRLKIPFTSSKLARDETGKLDETGDRFMWTVEEILNNQEDFMESTLTVKHESTGTSANMTFSELMDYQAYKVE